MKRMADNRGFTLIELISVLLILGILSVVATAKISANNTDLVSMDATLKNHIRYAQAKSMTHDSQVWGIQMDTATDEYWLIRAEPGQTLAWGSSRIQPLGADSTDAGYNGDRIRTSQVGVTLNAASGVNGSTPKLTLLFDIMGTPYWFKGNLNAAISLPLESTAGINRLTNALTLGIQDTKGNSKQISIEEETGFIP
ncbi:MAG: prepilin-type N-terminal cleavage/methylation domain-containing protein [Desulfobacterales bacterium]|nr:prepilin-type N-terminal cleavage/methylation domain-containing protein [Desulfobacterales bacterium]